MTGRTTVILGFALAAGLSGGCGTVANTVWIYPEDPPMRVYGGVKKDYETARQFNTDSTYAIKRVAICAVLDLPYSAVGDTMTLPYILACRWGLIPEFLKTKEKHPQTTPATPVTPATPPAGVYAPQPPTGVPPTATPP